jgi:SnoaL-like domain
MAVHTEVSPAEAADRLALRELFDVYAHCADRRDAEGQKALFTADTRFAVYMDGTAPPARATRSPTTSSPKTATGRS